MSQNTQIIQDEVDEVRTQCLAQEATMLDKLQWAPSDVRNRRDENKIRSQLIRDMETEREAMDKARQELARRSQSLESDLERAEQDYRDLELWSKAGVFESIVGEG